MEQAGVGWARLRQGGSSAGEGGPGRQLRCLDSVPRLEWGCAAVGPLGLLVPDLWPDTPTWSNKTLSSLGEKEQGQTPEHPDLQLQLCQRTALSRTPAVQP
jgi:hypothetical protein